MCLWCARAPIKVGEKEWMKEPYSEDIASHIGPELCGVVRKGGPEALAGVCAGKVLSREIMLNWSVDVLHTSGRQHRPVRNRECCSDSTRSKALCMYRTFSHGNREVPFLLVAVGAASREVKSKDVILR